MRRELITKTLSLGGSSDVTILAPIKPGLVPSLESVTYKTRAKRVLAALTTGRASSHEYSLLRVFSDAVERVGRIHAVRIAIIERDETKGDPPDEPDKILLAVTFDGGPESYIRVLWQKVGTLLDLIFCNTEGYVTACGEDGKGGRFEPWADWVRSVQIDTDYFYAVPVHTFDDVQYLRQEEIIHRQVPNRDPSGDSPDQLAVRHRVRSAEELAWSIHVPFPRPYIIKDLGRQGLRALVLLHRLTAYYLPGSSDGRILHRAAQELLQEFMLLYKRGALGQVIDEGRKRFDEQIDWLLRDLPQRPVPALPEQKPEPRPRNDVQFGIISSYPPEVSHACLVLIAFRTREGAARFLAAMAGEVTLDTADPEKTNSFVSLALTYEGLRAAGLSEEQLAMFPAEFREGMEARASVLGDYRTNHPRRWRLPTKNFPAPSGQQIELSQVHAVLQYRVIAARSLRSLGPTLRADDPLREIVTKLEKDWRTDIEILSVQPMVRHLNEKSKKIREHFGFSDGDSQPVLDPNENGQVYDRNQVQLGEFLLGYPNEAEEPDDPPERRAWLHNGSFLVVRKLSQDVKTLDDAVTMAADETKLDKELIYAKLVGRWRDSGLPLVPLQDANRINDFDYADEDLPGGVPGSECPFHAHIRRANPRLKDNLVLKPPPGRRTPRLMRRGMSYGPLYEPGKPDPEGTERGLVFMAYNASIAEQFEVVQRWLAGGNSTGGYSGQSDPLIGVAPNAEKRFFRFEHDGQVYRIALDGNTAPLGDSHPFVRLEWGAYLFVPSIKALKKLAAAAAKKDNTETPVWLAEDMALAGEKRVAELLARYPANDQDKRRRREAIAAWKALLEDPEPQRTFISAAAWGAIRTKHNGVLRTPYGVVVARRDLIAEVLNDRDGYSVSGYHERMKHSIGEIFLGLDDTGHGCPYDRRSTETNKAIGLLKKQDTFDFVRAAAMAKIAELIKDEFALANEYGDPRWELNLDVKEIVDSALADLCREWFGLPKDPCEIEPGGARWDWEDSQPVRYPGHFTAPSRYFFQPQPWRAVRKYGRSYGKALRKAFGALVKRYRDDPASQPALDATKPITAAILKTFERGTGNAAEMDDLAGSTIAGAMMGFLPTLDGNIRLCLNEWLRDGTFWSLRNAVLQLPAGNEFKNAEDLLEPALKRTMQLRPSPELIWRTPKRERRIGTENVGPRDRIVLSIVSATQQCLEPGSANDKDKDSVYPIFGGERKKPPAPHPTHACPGYEAAMGALLGFVSALLETRDSIQPGVAPLPIQPVVRPLTMRPGAAPLTLTLEGEMPKSLRPPARPAPLPWYKRLWFWLTGRGGTAAPAKPILVAAGDSWMSYAPWGPGSEQNIAKYLTRPPHNFEVVNIASPGTRLYSFFHDGVDSDKEDWTPVQKPRASSPRLDELLDTVKNLVQHNKAPTAILLSAGGTDVVEKRLLRLLAKNAAPGQELDCAMVTKQVNTWMADWLEKVLIVINEKCRVGNKAIPVFLHGYDYPVPDARALRGVSEDSSWLWTPFHKRGYEQETYKTYPARCTPVMRTLIESLNVMQETVAGKFPGDVFHVRLTGILSSVPVGYLAHWENELHPNDAGVTLVTLKFAEEIKLHALHDGGP